MLRKKPDARPRQIAENARMPKSARPAEAAAARAQPGILAACRLIESAATPPALQVLADLAALSPHHFHRQFKAVLGITPREYGEAIRSLRVRQLLPASASVTEALFAAGFNSSSAFYDKVRELLGMRPERFRQGGDGETIRFALGQCTLGAILVAATAQGICSIALGDDAQALLDDLQARFARAQLIGGDAAFDAWVAQIVGWVEQPTQALDLPLDIRGTAFQQRVWQALRAIPPGSTLSYSELAAQLGMPQGARAVAAACAANAIALAIPCHRVVRNDGALAGYRWGLERKRALLDREQAS
ncbi:bifunctional DNA-binding transcriptional regulator/O6-methylguanine-DNA methyltransferase Ada [Uliginosibacterium sediminicola]